MIEKKWNFRGASHIEIIFAFLVFMSAVGIALFFFRPGGGDKLVDVSLDYVNLEVIKNTSVLVETYAVNLLPSSIGMNNIEIKIPDAMRGGVLVKNYSGNILQAYRSNNSVFVKNPGTFGDMIYVLFSEDFNNGAVLSGIYNSSFYRIASSNSKELVSEKRVFGLVDFYNSNYFELKKQFNLPDRVNFGFDFNFSSAKRDVPANFEVFSRSKRIEVLMSDGSINFNDFNVRVW